MSMDIEYAYYQDYMIVRISGTWTQVSARHAIDQIKENAMQAGLTRIVLDILDLPLPGENLLRYETGTYIAETMRPPFRVALVGGRPDQVNHFVENVASNRGARFRIFVELEPALKWLLSDKSA